MKKKILIIDDEANIADTLADILEIKGFEVQTASRGETGLSMVLQHKPDLILCDIMMPEMDGYQVLEAVRQGQQASQTPFIFLSAKDSRQDFREGMTLGADDYLTKPVDMEVLLKAIENRLHKHDVLLQKVQLEETQRMSRELHDTLQQTLLGLQMKLTHFKEKNAAHPNISEIDESLDYLELAFSQFRMILEQDHSIQTTGFIESLQQMIQRVSRYVAFDINFKNDLHQEIPKDKASVLFKVLLEVLNNAIKHSGARSLSIYITGTDPEIRLTISDDGCGFDVNKLYIGRGLSNIRERVKELDGEVYIKSQLDAGTSIEVVFTIGEG